ncbi:MAG: D-glycero-beta-D-manno-heptose 1,7-bisphosphate 7-phosphatase [Cyanobacteriota bacterium]
MKPALFLDRDGVINLDHGYVHKQEDFQFVAGIFELVSLANRSGYVVVIVTNQAGIARGYYNNDQFHALSQWMTQEFHRNGAIIDAIYHCPHHPLEGIGNSRQFCQCRKPAPGMLLQASSDHAIALEQSILIGDRITDIEAGRRAGVPHLFLFQPNEPSSSDGQSSAAFRRIGHLLDPTLRALFSVKNTIS